MKRGKFLFLTITLLICSAAFSCAQVKPGDVYPDWRAGYMDIHHISTGKGECVFVLMPDGTTMMIDAGKRAQINATLSLIAVEVQESGYPVTSFV